MDLFATTVEFLREYQWVVLVTAASFIFAALNHFDEFLLSFFESSEEELTRDGVGTLASVSGLFGFVIAGIMFLYAQASHTVLWVEKEVLYQSLMVGALELTWLIPYFYAVNRSGALEAAPLFQCIPVLSLYLGLFAFGEVPTPTHALASCIIVIGGVVLNLVPGTWKLDWRTIVLMLFASGIIALIYFLFKGAALEGNFVATAFWSSLGMASSTMLMLVLYRPYRKEFQAFCVSSRRSGIALQSVNETLNTLAVLLSQRAVMLGPTVMSVTALSNGLQSVFILLIGWILTRHEKKFTGKEAFRKVFAISAIAAGASMLAL